jgi:hypothetical protein
MIPRPFLITLVFALPILVVALAVILGSAALASALGDAAGSRGLLWVAAVASMILVMDSLMLLVVLGLRALEELRNHE